MPESAPPAALGHNPTWAWLLPTGPPCAPDCRSQIVPCGRRWDAIRTPEHIARPIVDRLRLHSQEQLGPVLCDTSLDIVYWLVTLGASSDYPAGSRLLTPGTWLTLPNPARSHPSLVWLHLPEPDVLMSPGQLADHLTLEASL